MAWMCLICNFLSELVVMFHLVTVTSGPIGIFGMAQPALRIFAVGAPHVILFIIAGCSCLIYRP